LQNNMNIKSATFVKGVNGTDPIMDEERLQVAFIGRSNVGKSSLINSLTGEKDLVRSSPLPGKTREINFFLINHKSYFVDLPGYGYARMHPKEKEHLRRLIFWYLETPVQNRTIVLIIDAKVGPSDMDLEMLQYLQEHRHEVIVVANKVDKLKQGERIRQLKEIQDNMQTHMIMPYSAETHEGRMELLKLLL
jgi:GTP-binding protein